MHLRRLDAQDCPRPGMPPVRIGNHLRLINDRHIVFLIYIKHFYRGGNNPAVFLIDAFLPGQHGAWDPVLLHLFIDLQRKKAQRPQVDTVLRFPEALQRLIGFTAVGRADMEDEFPFHFQGLGKFHLRPGGNHIYDLVFNS